MSSVTWTAIALIFVAQLLGGGGELDQVGLRSAEVAATATPATIASQQTERVAAGNAVFAAEEEGRSDLDRVIIAVFLAVLAAALLTLITRRGRRSEEPEGPAGPSWSQRARSAYTNARWLYDALDTRAVITRRNAQPDAVIRFSTDIERRHTAALNELYGLETDAPTGLAGLAVQDTSRALRNLRSAFDDAAAFTGAKEPGATGAESDVERRLLAELELARSDLEGALDALADAIRNAA